MLIPLLVLVPFGAGLAALAIRPNTPRRVLLVLAALAHAALTAQAWRVPPEPLLSGWLALDDFGLVFLSITSALFLVAAFYGAGYLAREAAGRQQDMLEPGVYFRNGPESTFTACLLFFLATMTLVTVSHHFGLLWVAVEASTLASAPLIYYHRHHRSLEATWKYLVICSVGVALALLGNFFLAVALERDGGHAPMVLGKWLEHAPQFHLPWLKAAFVFFLVGYGTKMGLAPLHTWLPDAHSESPSVVSALLSGALLNCAFLGILRVQQVCGLAGIAPFGQGLLVGMGLLSMACAAIFILGQADYKRMLAYSSVEHMGILALGVGLGGAGAFGSMLHAVNHSMTKGMLFLLAGNILAAFKTKSIPDVRGVLRVLPVTGGLWLLGFLAITGSPPFGPFLSEFTILRGALEQGHPWVAAAYLALLALIFVGMATAVLAMTQGQPAAGASGAPGAPGASGPPRPESFLAVVPPLALAAVVFLLGVQVPPLLGDALHRAARALGGS